MISRELLDWGLIDDDDDDYYYIDFVCILRRHVLERREEVY